MSKRALFWLLIGAAVAGTVGYRFVTQANAVAECRARGWSGVIVDGECFRGEAPPE